MENELFGGVAGGSIVVRRLWNTGGDRGERVGEYIDGQCRRRKRFRCGGN